MIDTGVGGPINTPMIMNFLVVIPECLGPCKLFLIICVYGNLFSRVIPFFLCLVYS